MPGVCGKPETEAGALEGVAAALGPELEDLFSAKDKVRSDSGLLCSCSPSTPQPCFFSLLTFGSGLLLTHLSEQRRREEVGIVH